MDFTLEEFVMQYPIEVAYKISDRPESDLCENKTVITWIADRNGSAKYVTHWAHKFFPINNDVCLFTY